MNIDTGAIYDTLVHHGFYKSPVPVPRAHYERILDELTEHFDPIEIRLGIKHPNLGAARGLSAHNECNHFADGLAWYCVDDGGASECLYISPMAPIEAALREVELEHLSHARLSLLRLRVPHTTIARRERGRPILLCPFGPCSFDARVPGRREAIDRFYRLARACAARHRVRAPGMALRTGEFLIVDDRRYVHGRDALPEGTSRALHRSYFVMREREHWLTRTVAQRPFGALHPVARAGASRCG